jgi:chromosome segregation ATPase
MLTNELLIATSNLKNTKSELKKCQEALKKLEKETSDSKKQLDVKEAALDKARKDRDTLWSTINSDKYSNFSNFEEEKTKIDSKIGKMECHISELESQLNDSTRCKEMVDR